MGGLSTRLRLRVSPGSTRAGIVGRHGDAWKIRVTAAAERGRANDATVRLLADALGIPPAEIRLVAGHSSRDKTVELAGLDADEAERRLLGARDSRPSARPVGRDGSRAEPAILEAGIASDALGEVRP